VPKCQTFLVTEAERKHVRRRASLVAVVCFLPGRAKDLSAPLYRNPVRTTQIIVTVSYFSRHYLFINCLVTFHTPSACTHTKLGVLLPFGHNVWACSHYASKYLFFIRPSAHAQITTRCTTILN